MIFYFSSQKLLQWYCDSAESCSLQSIRHQQRNLRDRYAINAGQRENVPCQRSVAIIKNVLDQMLCFCANLFTCACVLWLNRFWRPSCLFILRGLWSKKVVLSCMGHTGLFLRSTVCLLPSFPNSSPGCTLNSPCPFSQVSNLWKPIQIQSIVLMAKMPP